MQGHLRHFSVGGLYEGLALLVDDETRSYWHHITGEAVHGPAAGSSLETWNVRITRVARVVRQAPRRIVLRAPQSLWQRLASRIMGLRVFQGRLPPGFRRTMGTVDPRLPEMEIGLGVVEGPVRRFYPLRALAGGIADELNGQALHLGIDPIDGVPFAVRPDGSRPMQLFSRWYGFAATYPACEVRAAPDGG